MRNENGDLFFVFASNLNVVGTFLIVSSLRNSDLEIFKTRKGKIVGVSMTPLFTLFKSLSWVWNS